MSPPDPPDWTDANESDPGVTILELLAYAIAGSIAAALTYSWFYSRRASSGR